MLTLYVIMDLDGMYYILHIMDIVSMCVCRYLYMYVWMSVSVNA